MIDVTNPRWAQSPDDAAGAGGAGATETKTVEPVASETPAAGAGVPAAGGKDGGTASHLDGPGAGKGDTSQAGKDTTKGADKDAGAAGTPAPIKVTLPEKIPDGVSVDKDFVSGFEATATKLGLTSDQANALVAWDLEQEGQRATKTAQALAQWSEEQRVALNKDPEYGGKNLAESQACVQRALNRFGKSTGLVDRLKALGLENDPAIIKTLAAIGKAISEDRSTIDTLEPGSNADKRMASLFPSHAKLRKEVGG